MHNDSFDLLKVFCDVSSEEDMWRRRAAEFGSDILPTINKFWETAQTPPGIFPSLGRHGLLRACTSVQGEELLTNFASGLIIMELSRADGSVAVAAGIQGALCISTIAHYGSEEQKQRWIPDLLSGEKTGAFAMTEPEHGSDIVRMETSATLSDDSSRFFLNGRKRWIGNGYGNDLTIVFARVDDGQVGAFLVEPKSVGYCASPINGKISMRAITQADIILDNCPVDLRDKLPDLKSFKDASIILENSRIFAAWSALGHAISAYEMAFNYARERRQFGRPLSGFQIIQERLVDMVTDISAMALMCRRVAELQDSGKTVGTQASLVKAHNTSAARRVVSNARDMLGGNGILLENHIARHFADLEALHTFEGTATIQKLIVGREITGRSAFV
jgi:glutaryl-coA dehydrogenase